MRASRLTAIALLLEARGQMTAQALADEFEVSVRTIFRDMEALSEAGVPVYAERGSQGGFRLMDGYRMRPPGLTAEEAGALWLAGLPEAVRKMGWGPALTAAQAKLLAVLGPDQRQRAALIRERLHVDGPGWFGAADEPAYLSQVTEAVWMSRVIRVRYQSWTAERIRVLDPLGVVLKGGTWYLVARPHEGGPPRTYRVSAIQTCEITGEIGKRPDDFNLGTFWREASADFIRRLYPHEATLRISPEGMHELFHTGTSIHAAGLREVASLDSSGFALVVLPFENVREAARDLMRLGADVEVLEPRDLREEVRALAAKTLALYESDTIRRANEG